MTLKQNPNVDLGVALVGDQWSYVGKGQAYRFQFSDDRQGRNRDGVQRPAIATIATATDQAFRFIIANRSLAQSERFAHVAYGSNVDRGLDPTGFGA